MVGHSDVICNRSGNRYMVSGWEDMKLFVNNGLGLVELTILAAWKDIYLLEGWNDYTPYVVAWGVNEKNGNHFWDGGKYY